jgi:hypothetical protein
MIASVMGREWAAAWLRIQVDTTLASRVESNDVDSSKHRENAQLAPPSVVREGMSTYLSSRIVNLTGSAPAKSGQRQ